MPSIGSPVKMGLWSGYTVIAPKNEEDIKDRLNYGYLYEADRSILF